MADKNVRPPLVGRLPAFETASLPLSLHGKEQSDAAIHAKSTLAVEDGSPRPGKPGLAMTRLHHFYFDKQ